VDGEEPGRAAVRDAAGDEAVAARNDLRGEDQERDDGEQERAERADGIAIRDQPVGDDQRPAEERDGLRQLEERIVAVARPVEDDRAGVRRESEDDRIEGYPLGGPALVDEGQVSSRKQRRRSRRASIVIEGHVRGKQARLAAAVAVLKAPRPA
jgi:hypothetical protein